MTNESSLQSTLREFVLEINDFGTTESYNDLFSLARLIQTLFILKPGTYPNSPEMGIGIGDYMHEFLDSITINEIQQKSNHQIDTYIKSEYIQSIKIDAIENKINGKKNTIGVLVNLSKNLQNTSSFILTFEEVGTKGNVISKLHI